MLQLHPEKRLRERTRGNKNEELRQGDFGEGVGEKGNGVFSSGFQRNRFGGKDKHRKELGDVQKRVKHK